MKAAAQAIDVARAAKDAVKRINEALESATKRLNELKADTEAINTPRVQAAATQIQVAIDRSTITARQLRQIAFGALALPPQATVELESPEIDALAFGMEDKS